MRTTIELPNELRQKLMLEAASRNLRGFSQIVVEALEAYFRESREDRSSSIAELKGCLCEAEVIEEKRRITEARENWRT